MSYRYWTDNEIQILRNSFSDATLNKEYFEKLFNKKWATIKTFASKIGLRRKTKIEDYIEYIYSNYEDLSVPVSEMMSITGRSASSLQNTAKKLGLIRKPRNTFNYNFFDNMDTYEKWYILGLISADGCHSSKKSRITIGLQEQDKEILVAIASLIGFSANLIYKKKYSCNKLYTSKPQYELRIVDKNMSLKMIDMGIVDRKSLVLKFNKDCPDKFLNAYLLGYFDGDGCICIKKKHNYPIFTIIGTEDFCINYRRSLIDKCGIKTESNIRKDDNIFVMTVAGKKNCILIRNFLYQNATIFIKRKFKKFNSIIP